MTHAKGTFEVTMLPQPFAGDADPLLGRYALDKVFRGDLEAVGKGEMLGARTAVTGSAAYVAVEKVTGTLAGRTGTFVLQHTGTMTRGELAHAITVVPDSATGELVGLTGRMTISVVDKQHRYEFEYELPT